MLNIVRVVAVRLVPDTAFSVFLTPPVRDGTPNSELVVRLGLDKAPILRLRSATGSSAGKIYCLRGVFDILDHRRIRQRIIVAVQDTLRQQRLILLHILNDPLLLQHLPRRAEAAAGQQQIEQEQHGKKDNRLKKPQTVPVKNSDHLLFVYI